MAERVHATVPTLDTERKVTFNSSLNWSPSNIKIFGHSLNIDLPTGNLIISTSEVEYPYYNFYLDITRKYDLQEQYMQLTYQRNYPNVDPKPHWFGNWQFAYEVDADEVWHYSYPELHISTGMGINRLFQIEPPTFTVNSKVKKEVEDSLKTFGIPKRTLDALEWDYDNNDFLLRTIRGNFLIATGYYKPETLVYEQKAKIWVFNPISGIGYFIGTDYNYNISNNNFRDKFSPILVTKMIDSLGHKIELFPATITPTHQEFILQDNSLLKNGSKRRFTIKLEPESLYQDGLLPQRRVRKFLVKEVVDHIKVNFNVFNYEYEIKHFGSSDFPVLKKVVFPCSIIGEKREIFYHYEDTNFPGVISSIENEKGDKIKLEYIEDPNDNDERLNPRIKIKKIIDPEGIEFYYDYNHIENTVQVTITQNGVFDQKIKYKYCRDVHNTKSRFINYTEQDIHRGYLISATGGIISRPPNNPQNIISKTEYSSDARFNVEKTIDPLGRTKKYEYNFFNQPVKEWDFNDRLTEYIYDLPDHPSPTNPNNYDLLELNRDNIIRKKDPINANSFIEEVKTITRSHKYQKYSNVTSSFQSEDQYFSTHRIEETTDERGEIWENTYNDFENFNPISPTEITSPRGKALGYSAKRSYNDRGNIINSTDQEGNKHEYEYNNQGNMEKYIHPSGYTKLIGYYECGNWTKDFLDEYSKKTEFKRRSNGQLKQIIDPMSTQIEYEYYSNQRLEKIIYHRPKEIIDRHHFRHETITYSDLEYLFEYTSLGNLSTLTDPKGLQLKITYDEKGRKIDWFHNIGNKKKVKSIYDQASQRTHRIKKDGKIIEYSYKNDGKIDWIQYPPWSDGVTNNIPGKKIEFQKYNYFGNILTILDSEYPTKSIEYTYNEAGNVKLRRDSSSFELMFEYDDDGHVNLIKDSSHNFLLDMQLDSMGRVEILTDSNVLDGSNVWEYKYTKMLIDGTTKILNLYEIKTNSIALISEFDYDKKDRLVNLKHSWDHPGGKIFEQTIKYRDDNLIEEIQDDESNLFFYDNLKQLIYEEFNKMSFDYDQGGNRLYSIDKDITPTPTANSFEDNHKLKLQAEKSLEYIYDENGNIKTEKNNSTGTQRDFFFDGMDRLRRYLDDNYEIYYKYDESGKLVSINTRDRNTLTNVETSFSYLFSKPIIVKKDANLDSILTWDVNGRLLRIKKVTWNDPASHFKNSLFPLSNSIRDIVLYVNKIGNPLVEIRYNSWGESHIVDPNNLFEYWGYRGGILDKISSLILFGARWYYPKIGRWISEDAMLMELAISSLYLDLKNPYGYALNDPVNYFDPTGFQAQGKVIEVFPPTTGEKSTLEWITDWGAAIIHFDEDDIFAKGVEDMTDQVLTKLGANEKLSVLRIIDHGDPTRFKIGREIISLENVHKFTTKLGQLKGHFTANGFIDLRNCDVGNNLKLVKIIAKTVNVSVYGTTGKTNAWYGFTTGEHVRVDPNGEVKFGVGPP
ncbi:hypothetical protein ES708_09161 [subsurface metagenome]